MLFTVFLYMTGRKTPTVFVGDIPVGGNHPIVIQSMTNTDTADIDATAQQILELESAGSEIVRITVDRPESAKAVSYIIEKVRKTSKVPIVGDFHFQGHLLLKKYAKMAESLDKYRINPGNIGNLGKHDENFESILKIAAKYEKPIRIGGNGGSINENILAKKMDENATSKRPKSDEEIFEEALVESVLTSAEFALQFGIPKDKIILSAKMSNVPGMIRVYEKLAEKTDLPLHLGLTEAGGGMQGIASSAAALGILLQKGIGDTIRVSLTPEKNQPRTAEVEAAKAILESLELRSFFPKITSCPGCGRTTGNQFSEFASAVKEEVEKRFSTWKEKYKKIEELNIAIMGCVVNGPGEARHADVGIFFPGRGEGKNAVVYLEGKEQEKLSGENVLEEFLKVIEKYLQSAK